MKSPIKLSCRMVSPKIPIKVCSWKCDETATQGASFTNRRDPSWTEILHRSTRNRGVGWQVSSFRDGIPGGHIEAPTCELALKEAGIGRGFKLTEVVRRK